MTAVTSVEIGSPNDVRADDEEPMSLEERIVDAIESCAPQDRTIRPGRLAQDLGISIEEASAELSYLLAAVGGGHDGATFRFEDVSIGKITTKTMVFQFPTDFKRRLANTQRSEDFQRMLWEALGVGVKLLKIVTAFGLILSLLILSVAAVLGIIGAIIAMSRIEGGHRQRSLLVHQLRSIFYSLRQILWLYALFGPADEPSGDGSDPFFKEVAYDLFLFFSVCCGNPGSIFFWLRANQWQTRLRRRRRMFVSQGNFTSDIPGVTLVSNGIRGAETSMELESSCSSPQRGLLSIVVEFLFGPSPFAPGPNPRQVGLLRAAALTKLSHEHNSVTLEQMAPFTESPPKDLEDTRTIVQQGMMIVGYFHGIPSQHFPDTMSNAKAAFCFPELCSESAISISPQMISKQDSPSTITVQSILYDTTTHTPSSSGNGNRYSRVNQTDQSLAFLREEPYRLTRLTSRQFLHCVGLGTLNLVGVIWLRQSQQTILALPPIVAYTFGRILLPLLVFYAILFFVLPLGRLLMVVVWNHFRMERNVRRKKLADLLESVTSD